MRDALAVAWGKKGENKMKEKNGQNEYKRRIREEYADARCVGGGGGGVYADTFAYIVA
jgi:hypothetical protein